MKKRILFFGALLWSSALMGVEVLSSDAMKLNIGGKLQTLGTIQFVEDDDRNAMRLYLFNKQARINVGGSVGETKFFTEIAFGAEETSKPQYGTSKNPLNTNLSMKDFYFDTPAWDGRVRVGQFKPALNRESLLRSEQTLFAKRSVQNMGFEWGRDVGAAFYRQSGTMEYTLGVFTGGGANVPERYIPEELGTPMIAFKLGVNNGLDEDIYTPRSAMDVATDRVRSAVYASGFYIKDSKIGHNTVLGVKYSERSILLNDKYNTDQGENASLVQFGVEGALLKPLPNARLFLEGEMNLAYYKSDTGEAGIGGVIGKIGYHTNTVNLGLRISQLIPRGFSASLADDESITEITPSLAHQVNKSTKLIFDAPIVLNTILKKESGTGTYEFTTQANNTSSGTTQRGSSIYLRMMAQFVF